MEAETMNSVQTAPKEAVRYWVDIACIYGAIKEHKQMSVCLILYIPVNNLSVTSWRVFLSWTSTKLGLMCLD